MLSGSNNVKQLKNLKSNKGLYLLGRQVSIIYF